MSEPNPSDAGARDSVGFGVTHWSAAVGPYTWHEFDAARTARELQAIAAAGHRMVRTLLPWDVFMPTVEKANDRSLRDFNVFLDAAEDAGLLVTAVLFAQTLGDCIMVPAYAIDVDRRRAGVRTLTGGVVQPGGPRDQYTDRRMIEAELGWLEAMLAGFAGHEAIAAWDLGHDPASSMRPRRIVEMRDWLQLMTGRLRESGQRCTLTLGTADLTSARAVRPAILAPELDELAIEIDNDGLGFPGAPADIARRATFAAQLFMRLAGGETPISVHLVPAGSGSDVAATIDRLVEVGCSRLYAAAWSDIGPRAAGVPPFDRNPELGERGVVGVSGHPSAFGEAWIDRASHELERRAGAPWPDALDDATYYANLPDSLSDLYAAWERGANDGPAMLDARTRAT